MTTGSGGSSPEETKGAAAGAASPVGSGQANAAATESTTIGRYRVLDEIASGGMATVHLGYPEDAAPGKFVAIKKMHPHYARDPDFASMFLDEAMVCKYIRHENVVVTLDVVKEEDELLLVLELVDGESLSKVIKPLHARKGRVPRAIASAIVVDMLRGLHAAHEAKNEAGEPLLIVHRDVSPHNIVVSTDGRACVLDFGVAKARGRVQQTQKGQLKGKIAYMSPEQARGKPVDRRSDVFAAGIVLWELLVGQRLYDHDNEAALLVALISETPVAPSAKDPALESLDPLVLKALAVQPDDRYPTALAMAEAVANTIPPASRTEVATWIKTEARTSLARRQALMTRAQARIARAARGAPSSLPPPPTATQAEPDELPWDVSTTTTEDEKKIALVGAAAAPPFPRPAPPPRRPAPAPKPDVPRVSERDSDAEPEATLPLYTPPAEFIEKWKREEDRSKGSGEQPATSPPPGPSPAVALPFASLQPASSPSPSSTSPHVLASALASQAPTVLTPRGVSAGLLETMRISEPPEARAEGVPSQVTSVTLTTTDMPPPIPPEQVRRLTWIGSVTAAVASLVAIAVLVIASKKPWSPKPQETAARGLGLVQVEAARASTAAESAAKAGAEATSTPAPPVSASAAASAPQVASAPTPPAPPPTSGMPTSNSPGGWQPPKPASSSPFKAPSPQPSGKPKR